MYDKIERSQVEWIDQDGCVIYMLSILIISKKLSDNESLFCCTSIRKWT